MILILIGILIYLLAGGYWPSISTRNDMAEWGGPFLGRRRFRLKRKLRKLSISGKDIEYNWTPLIFIRFRPDLWLYLLKNRKKK